jgi:hypothetical protein
MLLLGKIASTTAKIPTLCYFFLDEKVAKKSRPNRNLSDQPHKFLKKTFFNEISSADPGRQISEWPLKNKKLFNRCVVEPLRERDLTQISESRFSFLI